VITSSALVIGAAIRVMEVRSSVGILGLLQVLISFSICAGALLLADRYESQVLLLPSRVFRRRLLLALFATLDCYLVLILLGGERVMVAVDI
jgi:hypothetical protein